jgi:hypothetical protein
MKMGMKMEMQMLRRMGVIGAVLAVSMLGLAFAPATAQSVMGSSSGGLGVSRPLPLGVVPPRLAYPILQYYKQHPAAWHQYLSQLPSAPHGPAEPAEPLGPGNPPTGSWAAIAGPAGVSGLSAQQLLTDGTVIVHSPCTPNWYKLTPNINGSYVAGTWTQIASLQSGYTPLYFAQAVLPDGRFIINGGEYIACQAVWTTLGAIYDPVADSWTPVSPPSGWTTIGDAQSVIRADGTYMLANCCTQQAALLNAGTLTWTATGSGKFDSDRNDEEGWTLLPDSTVLTVDAYTGTGTGTCGSNTERYNPGTGAWTSAGNTPTNLADCNGSPPSYELGPGVLRYNNTVVAFGGRANIVDPTAIFDLSNNTWSAGPNVPTIGGVNYTLADAPAVLLPSGNVLFAAAPFGNDMWMRPTHFFVLDGSTNAITQEPDTGDSAGTVSFQWSFLILPTGQIMATNQGSNVWIYSPSGTFSSAWQPVISSLSSTTLAPGNSYTVSGTQLNGLSQGAAYGDDVQSATNFPIVPITNDGTGHVFYARSFAPSTSSIAPGVAVTAQFEVPPSGSIETGASHLVVIANGIPSASVAVTVGTTSTFTLSVSELGPGTVTSSPAGINCPGTCSANFSQGTTVSLSETPGSGSNFLGWYGACMGNGGCSVTMNANENVMATFWTDGTNSSPLAASSIVFGPATSLSALR